METASQVARFERDKLLKWWAQSFAVGVRRIIVGFRDDDGAVRKLQTLETLKLPGYAARHPGRGTPRPRSSSRISSSPGSARTSVRFPRDRACAWSTNREDVNTRFARRWIPTRPISYPRERENNSRGRRRFAPREAPPAAAAAEAEATAEAPAASDPWGVANVVEEASAEAEAEAEAGRRRRRATRERTRRGGRNRTRTRRRGVQGTRTSRDDASRVRIYGGRDASREENSRRRVRNRVRFRRCRPDFGGARSKSNLGRSVVRPRVRVAGGAFRALVRERGCARARSSSQATPRAKSDARARFETARTRRPSRISPSHRRRARVRRSAQDGGG